jgi:hypothetical protein
MPVDVASMFDAKPDKTSLYQGDVLDDIPLIFIPDKISKWLVLRPDPKSAMTDIDEVLGGRIPKWFRAQAEGSTKDAWTFGKKEEFVAAKARKMRVIIVTQTCDLAQRSTFQVAPVYSAGVLGPKDKENLQLNEFYYMFFLPARPPAIAEDSYVDFSEIQSVPRTYFKADSVVVRFSEATRREFQAQVAEYFGRPFGFNARDRSPHTAEFVCVRCFYGHYRLEKKAVTKGERFPECDKCGDGLWVRISDAVQGDLEFGAPAVTGSAPAGSAAETPVPKVPDQS